jgi:hypothetical protein
MQALEGADEDSLEALPGILGGKPVLALAFDAMEMVVEAPKVVQQGTSQDLADSTQPMIASCFSASLARGLMFPKVCSSYSSC